MAPQYEIYIRDSSGTLLARRTDFISLSISRVINSPDVAQFVYTSGQPDALPYLAFNNLVQIYRRDDAQGIANQVEFAGVIRKIVKTTSEITTYQVTCLSMLAILGQRIVAYRSTGACTFVTPTAAETIAKTLFNFNVGSSATVANGRIIDGQIPGFTTTASAGTGNLLSADFAYMNLVQALQKVAEDGGGDFDVTYTAPSAFTFVWYNGQMGTDRTATVRLSIPLGTVAELVNDLDGISFYNTAIVGGTGEGLGRLISTAPVTPAAGINRTELFIDARSQKKSTASTLFDLGSAEMVRQLRTRRRFTATLFQGGALLYGRDYFLGDLVTVQDDNLLITQRVAGVDIDFSSEGREDVRITLTSNY